MKKDENGYIVIETIGTFTLFVFLMASILSLINIVAVQARIHYAMTQTAETISMYSYALEKMGIAHPLMGIAASADKTEEQIDTFKDNLNGLFNSLDSLSKAKDLDGAYESGKGAFNSGKNIYEQGKNVFQRDPKELLRDFLNYGLDEISSQGFELLLRELMDRYLSEGNSSGDEVLRRFNVKDGKNGLDFAAFDTFDLNSRGNMNSRLLTADGDVRIIVTYKIDYTFGVLPLPFTELTIKQEVITKAWLGGAK